MSLADLSRKLTELGRPVQAAAIRRIENAVEPVDSEKERRPRRVDVDDLMALAIALDAVPNRLLLPAGPYDGPCDLTPTVTVPASQAWNWAAGGNVPAVWSPWGEEDSVIGTHEGRQRVMEFHKRNNPHLPPQPTVAQAGPHWDEVTKLAHQIADLGKKMDVDPRALAPLLTDLVHKITTGGGPDGER